MAKKFTQKWVSSVKLTSTQKEGRGYYEYYDSEAKGLSLRVGKRSKVYYFENRAIKISKTKLGNTQEISLDRARIMANEFLKVQNQELQSFSSLTLGDYIEKVYKPSVDDAADKLRKMTGVDEKLLSMRMAQIRITDIEAWKARRLKQKTRRGTFVKPSTAKREYNSLRSIFTHAFKADHIPFNKVGGLNFEGIDEGYREAISDLSELQRIFDCVQKHGSPHLKLLWNLMLHTGGRPKELLNSKKSDIKKDATLFVHASHSKTGESRSISLSEHARNILDEWICTDEFIGSHTCIDSVREYEAELDGKEYIWPKKSRKRPMNSKEYLFWNNTTEKPIQSLTNSYRRLVNKYKDEYRFRDHTLYVLRHTFATDAIGKATIDTVRELLGHKSITTTQIYLSQDTRKLEIATNEISKSFEFSAPKQIKHKGTQEVKAKHKPQSYAAKKEIEQMETDESTIDNN